MKVVQGTEETSCLEGSIKEYKDKESEEHEDRVGSPVFLFIFFRVPLEVPLHPVESVEVQSSP